MNIFDRVNIRQLQLLPEKIKRRLRVNVETGCWELQGWGTGNGYGKVAHNGHHVVAHRFVYQVLLGAPLSISVLLDHLCRNRPCCNPMHLEPVSPQENVRRGSAVLFKRVSC